MTRLLLRCMLICCLALLAGCPKSASKGTALEEIQYAYSAAIRWGDFEDAWQLVDPAYREANPMSDLALERYQQIQISGYSDRNTTVTPEGDVVRNVELRVINKHTMAERTLRYREQWRWDPVAKRWWLVVGLPDLWNGE